MIALRHVGGCSGCHAASPDRPAQPRCPAVEARNSAQPEPCAYHPRAALPVPCTAEQVESALVAHKAVAEAAVVGYSHPVKGQGIWAYVTLKEVRGHPACARSLLSSPAPLFQHANSRHCTLRNHHRMCQSHGHFSRCRARSTATR